MQKKGILLILSYAIIVSIISCWRQKNFSEKSNEFFEDIPSNIRDSIYLFEGNQLTKENIETEENTDVPATAKVFMELLMPQEAEVLASYDHYNWKEYAAITKNHYGKGIAIYIGCMTDDNTLKAVLTDALNSAEVEIPEYSWPVIVRKGTNDLGKYVRYILNYSAEEQNVVYHGADGTELFSEESVQDGETVTVLPWNVKIIEEL